MKIEELHIDAFGRFEAFDLKLEPGLNLLYGANEAGKSTLLSFVRAILFGFEKRNAPARYQPENAPPSGHLKLSSRMGLLKVVRTAGRRQEGNLTVFGADGERLETEKWVQALAGVSRELFFEVFAFGLRELSTFERLAKESSVSEALFAAGMQGARRFPEAMDRLRKSTEALYSVRGKKPLNAVLTELGAVQEQLRNLSNRPEEYFHLLGQSRDLERALDEWETKILALQGEQNRQRALLQSLKRLDDLDAATSRFESAESFKQFPEAGAALLKERLGTWSAACEEQRQLEREIEEIHAQIGGEKQSAEAGSRGSSGYRKLVELREQLMRAREALSGLEAGVAGARKERERVEDAIRRQTAEQQKLPATPLEDLKGMLAALRRMPSLQAELKTTESIRREKEQAATDFRQLEEKPPELGFRLGAFAVSIAAALAVSALSFLLEGALSFLGVGFGVSLAATLWLVRRRSVRKHALALDRYSDQNKARTNRLAKIEAEIASADQRQGQIRGEIGRALSEIGLDREISTEELSSRGELIESEIKRVEKRIGLSRELEKVSAELAVALREERNAQANRVVGEASISRIQRELEGFLGREGFSSRLSIDEALEAWHSRAALNGRLAMLDSPLERARATAEKAKLALDDLLRLGDAKTVEDFRVRIQRAQVWRDEQRRLQELQHQIEGAAGTTVSELRGIANGGAGVEELRLGAERIDAQLPEASSQKRQLAEKLGGLRQKLSEWEKDEETSRLRAEEEVLRAKAGQLAERYAVDRLAMKLLTQAREEFHARYQPELIQRASVVFSELTSGRYHRVLLEPGKSELVVRERGGAERMADALSRGTREQLYLAFRIALIEDFSHRLCPLPVLVDDIWVNFDRKRTEAAIRVFARLAQSQQVIAFTCHEHIRDRFRHHGATSTELGAKQQLFLRLHSA